MTITRKYAPRRRQQRFSLVELLVVIFIISILASLVLPALQQALSMTRSVQCMSNCRQVHVLVALDLNDHNNQLTPCERGNQYYWLYDLLVDYDDKTLQDFQQDSPLIARCPEREISAEEYRLADDFDRDYWVMYGLNYTQIYPNTTQRSKNLINATNPGRTILYADSTAETGRSHQLSRAWSKTLPSQRHLGNGNFSYLDGHCESQIVDVIVTESKPWFFFY